MSEEQLIPIEELIRLAKKQGLNFGKTDPYNRLRYYTKISLLPHMERRKAKNGSIKAFYPASALEKLVKIETLKVKGLSNEEIAEHFEKEEKSLSRNLKLALNKTTLVGFLVVFVIALTVLNHYGVISLGKDVSGVSIDDYKTSEIKVLDSGTAVLRAGKEKTFVRSANISTNSQVEIAFKSSFAPAVSYTIETKVPQEGFVIALDTQTATDASFSWWISE